MGPGSSCGCVGTGLWSLPKNPVDLNSHFAFGVVFVSGGCSWSRMPKAVSRNSAPFIPYMTGPFLPKDDSLTGSRDALMVVLPNL